MKNIYKLFLGGILGAVVLSTALPALAAKVETEDAYIADLASPKDKVVIAALQGLEKNYPTSETARPKIKALLTDARPLVRDKAARVLGALHADVSADDLKNIAALLDSSDKNEIMEGLKALRGLKAESTVPKIVPLLKHSDTNVKRDACRTLAIVGNKSVIKDLQPLQSDPDPKVQKDASDAIYALEH